MDKLIGLHLSTNQFLMSNICRHVYVELAVNTNIVLLGIGLNNYLNYNLNTVDHVNK